MFNREKTQRGEARSKKAALLFNFEGPQQAHMGGTHGGVAQLGEHLPCKQGVMGSNPIISTKGRRRPQAPGEEGRKEMGS